MQRNEIINQMEQTGCMAVVRIDNIERGREIASGCLNGGVDVMEISYTSSNAGEYISQLNKEFGDKMLIGAGTVIDSETARNAIIAGAKFIIAPSFSQDVALMCNRYQIPYCPGCTTYTEMITALEYGAAFIKCFPISNFYGPQLAKVVKTPLPYMPLLISGGIDMNNIEQWLINGADCLAMGGLLTKGTSEDIANNANKIIEIIRKHKKQKD